MSGRDNLLSLAATPNGRVQLLQRLLGEGPCRQLGIYPIPEGFKLSVAMPVYNEKQSERHFRKLEDLFAAALA